MKLWLKAHKRLGIILLVFMVVLFAGAVTAANWKVPNARVTAAIHHLAASDVNTNQLLALTNKDRASAGVPALTLDANLSKSAADKCTDMVSNNYYDHVSPTGVKWSDFIHKYYTYWQWASENINVSWGSTSASVIEQSWMNSPEHKANILDSRFTSVGLASCLGTYQTKPAVFVVEHFLDPEPPTPAPMVQYNPNPRNLPLCPTHNTDPFWNPVPGLDCF